MGLTQVSTDGVKNDAITKTKIPADQIEASELANDAVDTNAIQDDAVTEDKLANSINTAIAANTAKDLTALSASNLTSGTVPDARFPATLPAASGANLTNLPPNRVNRNLIINGAMQVAQRGTSSTSSGYQTVDRFSTSVGGTDEAPTQAQVDLSSSDTPYSSGFRKAFKLTNGNQTSGAGGTDFLSLFYSIEAQDIANSGWNYIDPNSKLTIQFWAKSSVAKTFILSLYTQDGTDYAYNHKYALAANTWTKITHTFVGNSNLTFDNNNGLGIQFQWYMYTGTTYTSGSTVDQWVVYNGNTSTPDDTSDWWTTNDATFEITGVQLEVGSVATDFEHRSFGQELALCQRYFEIGVHGNYGNVTGGGTHKFYTQFKTQKRSSPTLAIISSGENYVSSVNIAADPSDATLGCRIQGSVVATGDNKYIDAKFSSNAEL